MTPFSLTPLQKSQGKSGVCEDYERYISRSSLSELHVGWQYESGSDFAGFLRRTKNASSTYGSSDRTLDTIGKLWSPVVTSLLSSLPVGESVSVLPLPSRSDLNRHSATMITAALSSAGLAVQLSKTPQRTIKHVEMKYIHDWKARCSVATSYRADVHQARRSTLILVDDVVASGSSLRAVAATLDSEARIIGVALTADVPGYQHRRNRGSL